MAIIGGHPREINKAAEAAQPAVQLDVPLGVEIGSGLSWGAAH